MKKNKKNELNIEKEVSIVEEIPVSAQEESGKTEKIEKKEPKKKTNLKAIITLIVILLLGLFVYFDGSKKTDILMDIVDTNSSISKTIDEFIKTNEDKKGVHSLKDDGYTYVLIVSEKSKATEMSISLYNIYKQWFKINIEYEIEINEDTISKDNPDKVQKMLVRFKESGKLNPIEIK